MQRHLCVACVYTSVASALKLVGQNLIISFLICS